tara:strand:+ start:1770 stop:4370 length:2601 start_codon:yes stop_codon:yes gene_type:complete
MRIKDLKEYTPIILIFLGSIVFTFALHLSGSFSYIEMKLYDFRFSLRGAVSGSLLYDQNAKLPSPEIFSDKNDNNIWDEGEEFEDYNGNGLWDDGLDVVLVEIDDESYEYLNEPRPYSRSVWARAVTNLTKAGAKVITIDIEFDKPDHQIENLKNFLDKDDLNKINFIDGDIALLEAIRFAKTNGTEVILASKVGYDKDRNPSTFRVVPHPRILDSNQTPYIAQVDISKDIDGIQRLYPIFNKVSMADTNYYYTLAVSSALRFKDVKDDKKPTVDFDKYSMNVGSNLDIPIYGRQQYFLINYYGPRSHSFKTFRKYPLVNILDTRDYLIGNLDSAFCYDSFMEEPDLTYKNRVDCEAQEDYYWTTDYDSDWIDMYINPMHELYFIMKDKNPFKDKIVFVGTSLAEDHDFKDTPFLNYQGGSFPMPGVEVHANATQQILDGNYISYPLGMLAKESGYHLVHFLIISIITFLTLLVVMRLEPFSGFLFVSIELILWLSYSIGLFFNDYIWIIKLIYNSLASNPWAINMPGFNESSIVPVIFPAAAIIIPYGINLSYKLIVESNNKRFLKESFGAYISPDLIDQMFDEKQEPKLGGDPGYHTMMFSDIASFSTFSEKLEAESLLKLLNEYLTAMTNILINNKGTLDKYIGDAIVAFYGAPIDIDDHEYLACKTALSMNDKLEELRQKWKDEGDLWPEIVHNMQHRIGINAGKIVVGNMGSEMKLNYTMTGDQVNLTARLESSAKQLGIAIQVGENIYDKVKDRFIFRDLGKVIVVGRNQSLNVYELIANIDKVGDKTKTLLDLFHKGLVYYHNQDWDKAIETFIESDKYEEVYPGRKINPSQVFINRSKELKNSPPGPDWDGTYALGSK